MRVTSLGVRDWRNLVEQRLETDSPFVVLHGDNGQGKTNLLEAVYVLATLRSFREPKASRWVAHDADSARIVGGVRTLAGARELCWGSEGGRRSLAIDGASTADLSAWFGAIRAVVFCPEHVEIIRGGPEQRRDFLDRAVFTVRPSYLDLARDYRRVVRQKTALLAEDRIDPGQLDLWNDQLVDLGARVMIARHELVTALRPELQRVHARLSGTGSLNLALRSCGGEEDGLDACRQRLRRALDEQGPREVTRRRVLVGPHRDDLDLFVDGRLARRFASQGQARSVVLSLKLAELMLVQAGGTTPLFLLDDLTSELDAGRRARLVELLAEQRAQVWITTTDPGYLGPVPDAARWAVRAGRAEAG